MSWDSEPRCWRCGNPGHQRRNCTYQGEGAGPVSGRAQQSTPARHFPECGHNGHNADQQALINARGLLKVKAALRGDLAELERLAALTPSCCQSDAEWMADTYAVPVPLDGDPEEHLRELARRQVAESRREHAWFDGVGFGVPADDR